MKGSYVYMYLKKIFAEIFDYKAKVLCNEDIKISNVVARKVMHVKRYNLSKGLG